MHFVRINLAVALGMDLEEGEGKSQLGGTPSLAGRVKPGRGLHLEIK